MRRAGLRAGCQAGLEISLLWLDVGFMGLRDLPLFVFVTTVVGALAAAAAALVEALARTRCWRPWRTAGVAFLAAALVLSSGEPAEEYVRALYGQGSPMGGALAVQTWLRTVDLPMLLVQVTTLGLPFGLLTTLRVQRARLPLQLASTAGLVFCAHAAYWLVITTSTRKLGVPIEVDPLGLGLSAARVAVLLCGSWALADLLDRRVTRP